MKTIKPFRRIIAFGDSFVWGDELVDPKLGHDATAATAENTAYREQHCFVGQLGTHYGVPTENFSWPGSSLQSAIWNYCWWRERTQDLDQYLVIVGLTSAYRTSFYNPNHVIYENDPPWHRYVHSTWVNHSQMMYDQPWQDLVKLHTVLTNSEQSQKLNYLQSVYFWQGVQTCHAGVLQFPTMPAVTQVQADNLIWANSSLRDWLHTPDLTCAHGHPNEKGHLEISNKLQHLINHAIL